MVRGTTVAAVAALLATSAGAGAGAGEVLWRTLNDATLTAELVGTEVEGYYSDGRHFTENMTPELKTFYDADDVTTDGTYWVAADRLCFSYAAPISTGCFEVWQRSENCYDNYFMPDGADPASTIAQRALGLGWDSRMWRTNAPSTCPAAAVADRGAAPLTLASR
jgi:hypothetical protein